LILLRGRGRGTYKDSTVNKQTITRCHTQRFGGLVNNACRQTRHRLTKLYFTAPHAPTHIRWFQQMFCWLEHVVRPLVEPITVLYFRQQAKHVRTFVLLAVRRLYYVILTLNLSLLADVYIEWVKLPEIITSQRQFIQTVSNRCALKRRANHRRHDRCDKPLPPPSKTGWVQVDSGEVVQCIPTLGRARCLCRAQWQRLENWVGWLSPGGVELYAA
jgi:hypothetical protein